MSEIAMYVGYAVIYSGAALLCLWLMMVLYIAWYTRNW
jgi:hypothetical protein